MQQKLKNYLKTKGLKSTRQRELILDVFVKNSSHITPEELHRLVSIHSSEIGVATVYRTLKLFVQAQIAVERRFEDNMTRYEPRIEGEHHYHMICTVCGHIYEFEDLMIEQRQVDIANQLDMVITSHRLELYGYCKDKKRCDENKSTQKR